MGRKMFFLLNPISGSGDKSPIRKLIKRILGDLHIEYTILSTTADGNYESLRSRVLKDSITDVVIAGGDGSVNKVVNSLRDTGVNFGIIPCGSGNGLAFGAGIPKCPQRALDLLFTTNAKPTDAFLVNNQFSCMLSGLGLDAQVAHDFSKQNNRGLKTYVKLTIANLLKAHTYPFDITTNQNKFSTQAFFINIANSNQFGNRFTIAPKASLNDGLLDVIIVTKMSKLSMLLSVLRQISMGRVENNLNRKRGIFYFQTSDLIIKNAEAAPLHIDGDPQPTALSLDIKIIPEAFRLFRP